MRKLQCSQHDRPPRGFDDYAVEFKPDTWAERVTTYEITDADDYSKLFG
ncbi:MAG: hypothetical protein GF363_14180 [Chitinivibrionales bacterium]|nr:hypothetical protein [Chitinivibrionales bacterium]